MFDALSDDTDRPESSFNGRLRVLCPAVRTSEPTPSAAAETKNFVRTLESEHESRLRKNTSRCGVASFETRAGRALLKMRYINSMTYLTLRRHPRVRPVARPEDRLRAVSKGADRGRPLFSASAEGPADRLAVQAGRVSPATSKL
jgi:hypothetical protein